MTIELFREDGYLKHCTATVVSADSCGVCVDQTVFYPLGGGQPGDTGVLIRETGQQLEILDCCKDRDSGAHLHIVKEGALMPELGERVTLTLNWQRRHRLMRMHSCMHMLCVAVPAPVTGGSISDGSGRLDFDLPHPPGKEDLEQRLNEIIQENHPMTLSWITDQEMQQQPELIRTMSVLPPMGGGKVRLVKFGAADLQPCGGTHVANSAEIGAVRVQSIKNKGKQNRRITIEFAE
ncbi:alanyl-tRNA editing protein [Candidatus Spongiihabitans sp.]|uniref:alanyl-tRNA editing protein n=1 Tax=Candidatus Spongiihabitans sp. TaxID=3101308 RepID=UPI003C7B47BB